MALWFQRTWPSLSLMGQMSQALPWDPTAKVEMWLCLEESDPSPVSTGALRPFLPSPPSLDRPG